MALNWAELWEEVSKVKSGKDTRKNAEDGKKLERAQINSLHAISHALHERKGVILADEVGLGKTWVALELIRRIIDLGGNVVVVAKEGILRKWKKEWIRGWGTGKELKFYEKDLDKEVLRSSSRKIQLYLIPSTMARRAVWGNVQKNIWNIKPDLIVFDEAHNFLTAAKANELIETLKGKVFLYRQVKALTNKIKEKPLSISQKNKISSLRGKVFTSNQIKNLCVINKKPEKKRDKGKILNPQQSKELKELLKKEEDKLTEREEIHVLALTATPLGIDIGGDHWKNFFNLLGLKDKYKLDKIRSLSKKIIRSTDKETEENKNLIAEYREQFAGIIFRSHRDSYYQEFFKEKLKGKFRSELLSEAVVKRIDKKPIEVDITEDQKEAWRTLVCAVEAMSFCPSNGKETKFDKRSRLTVANTHCLMEIIDELEKGEKDDENVEIAPISKIKDPVKLAQRIWEKVALECLTSFYDSSDSKEEKIRDETKDPCNEKKKKVVKGNPLYREVIGIVKKHFRDKKESKVLIFSYNTKPAECLCKILNEELKKIFKEKKEYCGYINGETSLEQREKVIKNFSLKEVKEIPTQEEQTEIKCLIAQIRVAGEGLDLHEQCDTVIFLQPEWSPIYVEQGIGRVDRINSLWVKKMLELDWRTNLEKFPKITVYFPKFKETYNFSKWSVLDKRWDLMQRILNGKNEPKDDVLHPLHYLQNIRKTTNKN